MAQTEQTNEYRSERKERLAKSTKKKNKKTFDATGVVKAVLIVICVIGLLAAIGGTLYAYGVPQKIMPAVKVEDRTYSVAEYSYYYTSVYQTYANQSYSTYEQYGFTLGFDYSKDPAAQTTTDDDGNTITYAEYFEDYVIDTLETYNYYLKLVEEKGIELSEENQTAIDDTVSELATYASTYGYSTSRYISVLYGKGLNEKKLRSLLEEQYLVSQYLEEVSDEEAASITTEQIEAAYAEDPTAYQVVDLRLFGLEIESTDSTDTTDSTATGTDAEAAEPSAQELLAKEMCEKVTDEASFVKLAQEYCAEEDKETFADDSATLAIGISKSTVESNIDEELATWLFSSERKAGDKTTVATDEYAYVIMIKNPAYREESPLVSARHILVSFESVAAELEADATATTAASETDGELLAQVDTSDTTYSSDVILEAYKQAKAILAEYEGGAMTEDSFAELAEEYSDDTASISSDDDSSDSSSTSTSEGGLYEDIAKGKMVTPFENWVYDESRQPGDTGIIQTSYGFHVMYFVSAHEEAAWIETIRETLASDLETAREDEVETAVEGTATPAMFEEFAINSALKVINKLYVSE